VAPNGRAVRAARLPLVGVERTSFRKTQMSESDPERTSIRAGDPQMVGSIARRQMSDRELNLSVAACRPVKRAGRR